MGTWDFGPFDNDTAADWSGELNDAEPGRRVELIREALTAAANEDEYLDSDYACEAIAAAAVVASQLPGGPAITTSYGPDFLVQGGTIDLPDDLPELALQALARVAGEDSEWRDLWEDSFGKALRALEPIRAALEEAL
ncbi:hypothetical protein Acy02nite_29400 [Actinoplanes cyaneus]|uniref:DUF4259 domain-containing protein n=1 Tax=Actinoplanes cyaneus TaxID=52696 RepID=A0A919M745_9ACTN|nr:DUF4259 domain-containing protein [Actinoplanes cyaneus]MCW2137735.1 protein of unknown function (DUF4259) [Actinoplanes cyaneus]GID65059.1 hypothetical protein Acy02nite_29400 [Actinoplanes cyaneus]